MGIPKTATRISAADYLAMEEAADFRSQYFDGEIYAMSGGTANHSRIKVDCSTALNSSLSNSSCELFDGDMKVRIKDADAYVYPDATAVSGQPKFEDIRNTILLNPTFILEVLSESTSGFDRGEEPAGEQVIGRFDKYMTLPSLREYMILEQKEAQADVFFKQANGKWELSSYFGLDAVVELQSLGVKLPLSEVYRRVVFDETESGIAPSA
jgi:Uma2 family endonuclease